jgi:hypothetical protein
MLSAPTAIPAMIEVSFGVEFAAPDFTCSSTNRFRRLGTPSGGSVMTQTEPAPGVPKEISAGDIGRDRNHPGPPHRSAITNALTNTVVVPVGAPDVTHRSMAQGSSVRAALSAGASASFCFSYREGFTG